MTTKSTYIPGTDEIRTNTDGIAYLKWCLGKEVSTQAVKLFRTLRSKEGGFPLHIAIRMVLVRMRREQGQ